MLISGTVLAKLTLTQRNDFFLATSDLSIVEGLANKATSQSLFFFSVLRTVHPQLLRSEFTYRLNPNGRCSLEY